MLQATQSGPPIGITRYSPAEVARAITFIRPVMLNIPYGQILQILLRSHVYISEKAVLIVHGDYIVAFRGSEKEAGKWLENLGHETVRYHRYGKLKTVKTKTLVRLWEAIIKDSH